MEEISNDALSLELKQLERQIDGLEAAIKPHRDAIDALQAMQQPLFTRRSAIRCLLWQREHHLFNGDELLVTDEFLTEARARVRRRSWSEDDVEHYITDEHVIANIKPEFMPDRTLHIIAVTKRSGTSIDTAMALRMREAWVAKNGGAS